jgi:hypothetical protein
LTELTRRQLRELERSGQLSQELPEASLQGPIKTEPIGDPPLIISSKPLPGEPVLTRRELRLRAEAGENRPETTQGNSPISNVGRASALAKSIVSQGTESEEAKPEIVADVRPAEPQAPRTIRQPLPAVGESRRSLRNRTAQQQPSNAIEALEVVNVEIPEEGLRGANYLGELSTQSIVLDVAPEALSITVDTGEIFTTGSIAILPDVTGSMTGSLDGIDLDSEDAVTGVISVVDPVSARDLIDERSPLGVLPHSILRRGWWRPWAVGAVSVLMALAAILASITIFNALGD